MVKAITPKPSETPDKKQVLPPNPPKIKKVHLPKNELSSKMKQVQDQITALAGAEHHKKRKRLFYKLAKLKKACEHPETYLIDATDEKTRANKDLQRRIKKKKSKSSLQVTLTPQNKKKSCLICKRLGHTMNDCPDSGFLQKDGIDINLKICYNCGRTDHTLKDCRKKRQSTLPFAVCYVCKGNGHIARECSKNEKGMYAKGGGCYICDSVRHKASDCPKNPVNMIRNKRKHGRENLQEEEEEVEVEEMGEKENVEELEPNFEEPEGDL